MSSSEHRFLKPNPVLLCEFGCARRRISRLAHELGAGASCTQCKERCPGFQLHYWRKVCQNCRCGKAEHNVAEDHHQDPGEYFVGKIFERPMRTREEESQFCYGHPLEEQREEQGRRSTGKIGRLDWIPPSISRALAKRYLDQLPLECVPIVGSRGSLYRKQRLQKQFPVYDIVPEKCHELSKGEVESMNHYVATVRDHVAGQGVVTQVDKDDDDDLPPPPTEEELLLVQLSIEEKRSRDGIFLARPIQPANDSIGGSPATASSPSRNASPSEDDVTVNQRSCQGCNGPLRLGDVAIRADRAGTDKMWHPQCFKCFACEEILVDLLYYFDSGRVFCGRDYATLAQIPRCHSCDELIFSAEYTGAENHFWHLKHFCCYECDQPLAGHKYIPVDSHPHCLPCYQRKHGKCCRTCGEIIDPEERRVSLQSDHWHAQPVCFRCSVCAVSLLGRKITRKDGFILCSTSCSLLACKKSTLV